jgi:hypothetical protein
MKNYWHYVSRTLLGILTFVTGSSVLGFGLVLIAKHPGAFFGIILGVPLVGFFLNLCYCLGDEIIDIYEETKL